MIFLKESKILAFFFLEFIFNNHLLNLGMSQDKYLLSLELHLILIKDTGCVSSDRIRLNLCIGDQKNISSPSTSVEYVFALQLQ